MALEEAQQPTGLPLNDSPQPQFGDYYNTYPVPPIQMNQQLHMNPYSFPTAQPYHHAPYLAHHQPGMPFHNGYPTSSQPGGGYMDPAYYHHMAQQHYMTQHPQFPFPRNNLPPMQNFSSPQHLPGVNSPSPVPLLQQNSGGIPSPRSTVVNTPDDAGGPSAHIPANHDAKQKIGEGGDDSVSGGGAPTPDANKPNASTPAVETSSSAKPSSTTGAGSGSSRQKAKKNQRPGSPNRSSAAPYHSRPIGPGVVIGPNGEQMIIVAAVGPHRDGQPGFVRSSQPVPNARAQLVFQQKLSDMAENWTKSEGEAGRRLVKFYRRQTGAKVEVHFHPVEQEDYEADTIVISCIWHEETKKCVVTSTDVIYTLEAFVMATFAAEERNRIRRNLEHFKPATVAKKTKNDDSSSDFYTTLMNFPVPKPRKCEKDIKIFPWRVFEDALNRVFSKYNAYSRDYRLPSPSIPAILPPPGNLQQQQLHMHQQQPQPQHSSAAAMPPMHQYAASSPAVHHLPEITSLPHLHHNQQPHHPQHHDQHQQYPGNGGIHGFPHLHNPVHHHSPQMTSQPLEAQLHHHQQQQHEVRQADVDESAVHIQVEAPSQPAKEESGVGEFREGDLDPSLN